MSDEKDRVAAVVQTDTKNASTDLQLSDFKSQIAPLLATDDLREKYATLYNLADRSAVVESTEMAKWDANQDFIVFTDKHGNGNFDIQRGFALKAMRVFEYGKRSTRTTTTPLPSGEILVNTIGEIFDIANPERSTEVQGACSTKETTAKGKAGNTRAYHDAVATAETRMLKRGVEELVGSPIINAMIKEIFGGFEIRGAKKVKNVSPGQERGTEQNGAGATVPDYSAAVRDTLRTMGATLTKARDKTLIDQKEFDAWKRRLFESINSEAACVRVAGQIEELLEQRRTDAAGQF